MPYNNGRGGAAPSTQPHMDQQAQQAAAAAAAQQAQQAAIARMSPAQLDEYLRQQQQNPNNSGQAFANTGAYNANAPALMAKYAGDPNFTQRVTGGVQAAQQVATNGWNGAADINAYQLGGDPAFAANERARLLGIGNAAQGRTGPLVDTTTVAPWQGAQTQAGNGQMQAGSLLYGQAQGGGAGTGLMGQAGNGLMALGQMPTGPSAAELAMRAQGQQAVQQQAALAAGARGGNSALALQNAAANSASIGGNLAGQVGIQRAQEDMANRQFSANALSGAANVYGAQNNAQLAAAQAAGGVYGGAGQTFGQGAGLNAGIAQENATNQANQMRANDALGLSYNAMGNSVLQAQSANNMAYDAARMHGFIASRNDYSNPDNTGRGTLTGSPAGDAILGGTISAAGAALAPTTGGASLAVAAPVGAGIAKNSDKRAKKNIKPAGDEIDELFRNVTGSQYEYKDPNVPGSAPGTQFGPMAQDLEKTKAGASVVGIGPNGIKNVDTGRLSLMTTSEVGKQRAQIDALARAVFGKKRAA